MEGDGKLFLKNYFAGQIHDSDDNPAVLPTFKKKENKEYEQIFEKFIKEQKKTFVSWREADKKLQNLRIMNIDKYNPLGFNINNSHQEIFIKNLQIDTLYENTYIKLKISSEICIYNYIIFLGEDANKDLIPIIIYDAENYYSLNLDDWDGVQNFYKKGQYIIIINPNYTIYDEKMYETKGTDGLLCLSPNETILFKDETDLNRFMKLLNDENFKNFKSLGDIMTMRKYYDKAIYFYEKAIKYDENEEIIIKIYSLLCECYIRFQYYTLAIDYINKCLNIIDILIADNIDLDKTFIITSLFRKIRCLVGLRNFKLANDELNKIKEDKEFQNHFKLDEIFINKFLSEKNNKFIIEKIKTGYDNFQGKYNIKQMLDDEKEKFLLDNGDYINPKLEISFDNEKGIKIVAKEDINIGEYILVEKAIYFCRTHDKNNNFETGIKNKIPFHIIHQIEKIDCVNNLIKIIKKSPLDYQEFFVLFNGNNLKENYESRLKNVKTNISNLNVEFIEQIFKLNSYKTLRYFYNINKIGIGLWKYFSLFNHSCIPNTTNYGIGDFIFVMPNRLIKKGEEVTTLYLSTPKYYESRKDLLKSIYNFECNCSLCQIEKNNREKNKNILSKYDNYLETIIDPRSEYNKKIKVLKEFPNFINNNKQNLSNYEIGKAYVELSSINPDFNVVYNYYNLANKYLEDDFETKKLNINKIMEFCDMLIEQGDKSFTDIYKKLYKSYIDFYKEYYNCNQKDIEIFIKTNKDQKIKDMILEQEELLKSIKFPFSIK